MDDPLVGVTIWQSAQLNKKTRARQDLLKQVLGGDGDEALSNGWTGGGREATGNGGRGSGRGNEKTRSGGRQGDGGRLPPSEGAGGGMVENGVAGEEEEEEEEELTERCLLSREGRGRKFESPEDHTRSSGGSSLPQQPRNFWLMRLFESKLFDMSIAIGYFLRSKEADVQAYLGNKLLVSVYNNLCLLLCVCGACYQMSGVKQ